MNRLRERFYSIDQLLVCLVFGIVVFGLVMLLSATGPVAVQRAGDSLYYIKHQLLVGVLPGSIFFIIGLLIPLRVLRSLAFVALFATIILLMLVYVPGIGLAIGGSRSWVRFGSFGFQPSELVKVTFLIYLSAWLARRVESDSHDVNQDLLPFLLALGAVMLLLIFQPDTGSMAVIVGMALLLYFYSGAPISWFFGLGALGLAGVWLLVKFSPYRAARFMTFLHPELDPQGIGYHINQAILAIGSGGFWGLGYGHSRQKFLYLPEVEADSLFAVIAEEMGFIVVLLLFIAFAVLVWRCFKNGRESQDRFSSYFATGVGFLIAFQVLLNVGSMTGLVPMTGVTLPLISHGGSSMTVLMGALGLVAGMSRKSRNFEEIKY